MNNETSDRGEGVGESTIDVMRAWFERAQQRVHLEQNGDRIAPTTQPVAHSDSNPTGTAR